MRLTELAGRFFTLSDGADGSLFGSLTQVFYATSFSGAILYHVGEGMQSLPLSRLVSSLGDVQVSGASPSQRLVATLPASLAPGPYAVVVVEGDNVERRAGIRVE